MAAPTTYKEIYGLVLSKFKNYDFAKRTEDEVYEILSDYLTPSIVRFKSCKQDLSDRDNELQQFNITLTDEEVEIIVNFMVIEYINANYINIPSLLKTSMTSKDFNVFSNANHLRELMNLSNVLKKENRQLMSVYSYSDSSLFNNE